MHKLDSNELFGTTLYTFNRIMEVGGKNGPDAFALYFRLMQQARMQQTNQTLSNNQFLMKAMGRGQDRLTKANKILKELGLIDRVQATRGGKIVGVYVRVNFLIDEDKVRTSYTTYNINLDEMGVQNEEVSGIGENLIQENLNSGKTITNAGSIKYINAGSIKEKEFENNSVATQSASATPSQTYTQNNCLNIDIHRDEKQYMGDLTFLKNVYPNIYGCNDKKALKHLELKIENGCDINKMIEQARLLKLEVRVKIIESRYVKKLENWILDYVDCDDIDGKVKGIIKAYRSMIDGGHTFKLNPINDLKEMYGKEKVNELWKDCNTNKIVLNLK